MSLSADVRRRTRSAGKELGWTLDYRYDGGQLILSFRDKAGQPVQARDVTALIE